MAFPASNVVFLHVSLTVLSVMVTLALSWLSDHLASLPPYLGDLGDKPLESTVFTQVFVGDAAVLLLVVHVRFVYVSQCLDRNGGDRGKALVNAFGVCCGFASAVALLLVACFQRSNAFYVHAAACLLFFSGGIVYFLTQTLVSGATRADGWTLGWRVVFSVGMVLAFFPFVAGYAMTKGGADVSAAGCSHRGVYVASASAQWILLLLFQLYVLSYSKEFQRVLLTKTRIIVVPKEEWEVPPGASGT